MSWLSNLLSPPPRSVARASHDTPEQPQAKTSAVEDFAAAVAHDLKAPLAAISMTAQLARRRLERLELESAAWGGLAGNLADIEGNARRMASQLDELLDVAQQQAGQPLRLSPWPTSLLAIVDAALAANESREDRHRIRVVATDDPGGTWDAARLARVVNRLITNAVKYSSTGSEVTLELGVDHEPDGRAMASLCVRDHGMPLSPAELELVFERFFRVERTGGSGRALGLAGARQIVEQHGGSLTAESHAGTGTAFRLRLPLGV